VDLSNAGHLHPSGEKAELQEVGYKIGGEKNIAVSTVHRSEQIKI
jgi:hypothetical protein